MHQRRTLSLAVLTGVLVAVILPALSQATSPGRNGEIAFARYRYVNSPVREEIWLANPNGRGLRRITQERANYLDEHPSWAPDGSKLLFTRSAPRKGSAGAGRLTIWSVNADGSDPQMLSRACRRAGTSRAAFARCPDDGPAVYSPNGRRIAFIRYTGTPGIAIADRNLRHVRSLLPFGAKSGVPSIEALAWSPDGSRLAIAFHNDNGKRYMPAGGRAIYIVRINGSGVRRLTAWKLHAGGFGELDWSPDGNRVLFRSIAHEDDDPGPSSGDIYTIRADGTSLRRLTHFSSGTGVQLGSYSPDGTQIVFTTNDGSTLGPGSAWPDVFVMRANGTNITQVTRSKNWEGLPQWGSAG